MNTAIIVGMLRGTVDRFEAYIKRDSRSTLSGWMLKFVPGRRANDEVHPNEISKALTEAGQSTHPHIMCFSKQEKQQRRRVAEAIRPYFRFRWLDNKVLGLKPDEMMLALNHVLNEEIIWAEHVMPKDIYSPLLLPECSFEADPDVSHLWGIAREFGDPSMPIGTGRVIEHFRDIHWRPTESAGRRWTDSSSRIFSHAGQRHGAAPFPRSWKYSFKIDDSFHFDVTSSHSRAFSVLDATGVVHKVADDCHINVDPHGYVRL